MKTDFYYENQGGGDEQYTPSNTVELLLPHIKHLKNKIIWCPFDKEYSQFVQVLKTNGYKVVYSHIDDGKDFFEYQPEKWDIIISNPPYKNKRKFWEHCVELGKPFLLLMPVNILNDSAINKTFANKKYKLQMLIPEKRTKFYNAKTGKIGNQPTFKAVYFGINVLKEQIILEKGEK